MANKAYIRIHHDQHIEYLVHDAAGVEVISGSAFHDDQLPEFESDLETYLILPGTDVLLLTSTLPKTSRNQLEKALPFALEEQLIDDLDNLHFVASKQADNGNVHVLVVKRDLLRAWLQRCYELGLYPKVAVPDYLTIEPLADTWHLYLDADNALLRQAAFKGLSIEQNQLNTLLKVSLSEEDVQEAQALYIDYDDANEHFEPETLGDLNITTTMAAEHHFCMEMFADGVQSASSMNLLSGDFVVKKAKTQKRSLWKWVVVAIITCCVIWLAGNIAQYFVYQQRVKKLETQVAQLYKTAFPAAQAVTSPRIRIERALKMGGDSGAVFLDLYTITGQVLKQQAGNVSVENLNFRNNNLTLSVTVNNFQTLANVSKALQARGFSVQQQNASSKGNSVSAQLVIKGASNG